MVHVLDFHELHKHSNLLAIVQPIRPGLWHVQSEKTGVQKEPRLTGSGKFSDTLKLTYTFR